MKLNFPVIRRILALVLITALSPFASAHQQTATISFSSPSLSGSFGVKLEPGTQALVEITSVSLIIDGYKFKLKDIGFRYDEVNNITFIAGLANGLDNVVAGPSSDFYLVWTPAPTGGYISLISYTSGTQVIPGTPVKLTIDERKADKNSDVNNSAPVRKF